MIQYIHIPVTSGIYQIVNKFTQKRYVGYASNLRQRLRGHFSDLVLRKHPNDYLQKAFNKYGLHNFNFSVLQECSKNNLCLLEDYWVKVLKTCDREFGYNIQETDPNGVPGQSQETIEKIRAKNKGKQPSELCKQKAMEYKLNNPMTDEHKRQMVDWLSKVNKKEVGRKKTGRRIIDCSTGIVYRSASEVVELHSFNKSTFSKYLSGSRTNKTNFKYLI